MKKTKLLDTLLSLLGYVETFKKTSVVFDETTEENKHTEIEWTSQNLKQDLLSDTVVCNCIVTGFFVTVLYLRERKLGANGSKISYWSLIGYENYSMDYFWQTSFTEKKDMKSFMLHLVIPVFSF